MVENKQSLAEFDVFEPRFSAVYHVRINYSKRLREMNCFLRWRMRHKCAVLDGSCAYRASGCRDTVQRHSMRPPGKYSYGSRTALVEDLQSAISCVGSRIKSGPVVLTLNLTRDPTRTHTSPGHSHDGQLAEVLKISPSPKIIAV